jgi:hypothetical protein
MFFTPDIEGSGLNRVKGSQEDIEKGVPVEGGRNVSLSRAHLGLEAWCFGGIGEGEASKALCTKHDACIGCTDECITMRVEVN